MTMKQRTPKQEHVVLSSDDEQEQTSSDNNKQIVLYNPNSNNNNDSNDDSSVNDGISGKEIVTVPGVGPAPSPIQCRAPGGSKGSGGRGVGPVKVLPAVGTFTVQCALCLKWRLIPTKEKYEEIREYILEEPFSCEVVRGWRPGVSCEEPGDLEQDGSRLWAIDKPSIAQAPPGWERELRIRGEGSSKFADVYYIAPTGKRLRSMVEVQKYLLEHPECISQGVDISQFSFQIPKPLQENYVRKRAARLSAPVDESLQVRPISWAAPDDHPPLQLGKHSFSSSYSRDTSDVATPPTKKKSRSSSKHMYSSDPLHVQQHRFKIKGPRPPPSGVYDI